MKEKFYKIAPHIAQNILITIFNIIAYKKRYGGKYKQHLEKFERNANLSYRELKNIQEKKFKVFVNNAIQYSKFYKELYKSLEHPENISQIHHLPIVDKEHLRKKINDVHTIDKKEGIISKTGGTTGKSLEVRFSNNDMQERFAMLDYFRGSFGYKLGEKTAWFSGKNILTHRDVRKYRFWKTDIFNKVRYYSTFHIKENYLISYVEDLIKFKPKFIVGFPSTILEIAKFGLKNNIDFPRDIVKAIFPTAETVTKPMRETIELFFKSNIYDQYASSEGAPFIMECKNNNLHMELQSGIFEVLDINDQPANVGRLVCTSFTTKGTPLIRYDIGDSIELSSRKCDCGNNNPLVETILGRIDDYVYSPENGKINLGNISNTLKDTKGIIRFQAVQNQINIVAVNTIVDKDIFTMSDEKKFIQNWRDRLGYKMEVNINYVNNIPVESSGKYRMVKNNIKHLLNDI